MNGAPKLNEHAPPRLTPEMASFRLLVLQFVRTYLARWGQSPSYSEIAAGLGAERGRVRNAVKRLVRQGLLVQRPCPRGLELPEDLAKAAEVLRSCGWQVNPGGQGGASGTNRTLPAPPVLDYHGGDDPDP